MKGQIPQRAESFVQNQFSTKGVTTLMSINYIIRSALLPPSNVIRRAVWLCSWVWKDHYCRAISHVKGAHGLELYIMMLRDSFSFSDCVKIL